MAKEKIVISNEQICPHCKEEIPMQMVQQGGMHMGCYNTEIDVWFISVPDAAKHGYYEKDITQVAEMLKCAEGKYLIERQQMSVGKFNNLPDFEGF